MRILPRICNNRTVHVSSFPVIHLRQVDRSISIVELIDEMYVWRE